MNQKKKIVITGSSSGFGKLMVETLAKKGHDVFACMRDPDSKNESISTEMKNLANSNNYSIKIVEMDVTSQESVDNAISKILEDSRGIDVVVNNAGIGNFGVNESFSVEDMQKVFDVNVFGIQRVNRAVLPDMRKKKTGLIIHISSVLGRTVIPTIGIYCATKHAVEALAETYNSELKELGIDSVIVQPGGYPTSFGKNMIQPTFPEVHASYGKFVEKIGNSFQEYFKSMTGSDAPNPQDIADAVDNLIDMPSGQRPLRTTVGSEKAGAMAINRTSEQVQKEIMKGFGVE